MFSNWRATSGGVLVPHLVPMVSGSKRGSHTVPSGLPSSYMDKALSVTPLLRSGEGNESSYCDIGGVLPVTTACPLDGVGGGATSDTVPMSTRQRVANITNEASNSTDDDAHTQAAQIGTDRRRGCTANWTALPSSGPPDPLHTRTGVYHLGDQAGAAQPNGLHTPPTGPVPWQSVVCSQQLQLTLSNHNPTRLRDVNTGIFCNQKKKAVNTHTAAN